MHLKNKRKLKSKIPLSYLEARIRQAEEHELSPIIHALVERYSDVFPDWEFMTFFIPKNNPEQRKLAAEHLIRLSRQIIQEADR